MKKLYFAYGSNLHKKQMKKRCPDSEEVSVALLTGHELTFRRGVANVENKAGSVVHGALYWVSNNDIKALDRYEGFPRLYKKRNIFVTDEQGKARQAFVYYMPPFHPHEAPSEDYLITIVYGFEHWGLPRGGLRQTVQKYLRKEQKRVNRRVRQKVVS